MTSSTERSSLPMPTPTNPNKPFSSFKVLSFDIYATLIDWEVGIVNQLRQLSVRISPIDDQANYVKYHPQGRSTTQNDTEDVGTTTVKKGEAQKDWRFNLGVLFNKIEHGILTAHPDLEYSKLLERTYLAMAQHFALIPAAVTDAAAAAPTKTTPHETNDEEITKIQTEAQNFGASVGTWGPFPDTISAMIRLSKYFRLVPLSNIDQHSFSQTRSIAFEDDSIPFYRIYTAQEIGSYKPDLRNFEYLLRQIDQDSQEDGLGPVAKSDICHVAQSLFHDHCPCKIMGISSVFIDRKSASMGGMDQAKALHEQEKVGYGWRFDTLADFADEVERQVQVQVQVPKQM